MFPKQIEHYVLENYFPYNLHLFDAFINLLFRGFVSFFTSLTALCFLYSNSDSSSDTKTYAIFWLNRAVDEFRNFLSMGLIGWNAVLIGGRLVMGTELGGYSSEMSESSPLRESMTMVRFALSQLSNFIRIIIIGKKGD